jgi:hypothetical protein
LVHLGQRHAGRLDGLPLLVGWAVFTTGKRCALCLQEDLVGFLPAVVARIERRGHRFEC